MKHVQEGSERLGFDMGINNMCDCHSLRKANRITESAVKTTKEMKEKVHPNMDGVATLAIHRMAV
jgi:hypothetical protein